MMKKHFQLKKYTEEETAEETLSHDNETLSAKEQKKKQAKITKRTSENTDQATSLFHYSLFSELIDKTKVKKKQTQLFSTKIQKRARKTY